MRGSGATYRLVVEGSDESVAVAILGGCHWCLGLDNGVNASDWREVSIWEHSSTGGGEMRLPRWATSVAISKRRWFLTSRVCSPLELMVKAAVVVVVAVAVALIWLLG